MTTIRGQANYSLLSLQPHFLGPPSAFMLYDWLDRDTSLHVEL